MDWLEAIDGLAIFALAVATIIQTIRMNRMQDEPNYPNDHEHAEDD